MHGNAGGRIGSMINHHPDESYQMSGIPLIGEISAAGQPNRAGKATQGGTIERKSFWDSVGDNFGGVLGVAGVLGL